MSDTQIKRIPVKITLFKYHITFEYNTFKGYKRKREVFLYASNENDAINAFKNWTEKQRGITNAQILVMQRSEKEIKVIEA